MSTTDVLRKLLDERGEDYSVMPDFLTTWQQNIGGEIIAWEDEDGVLAVWGLTPEQVITATLGDSRADNFWPIAEITTDHIDLEHGRVTQRWIPERTCHETMIDKFFHGCDSCGYMWQFFYSIGKRERPNYCPNCGARVVA